MSKQRDEVVGQKEALHREREETNAAELALSKARTKGLTEVEQAAVEGERQIAEIEARSRRRTSLAAVEARNVRRRRRLGACSSS